MSRGRRGAQVMCGRQTESKEAFMPDWFVSGFSPIGLLAVVLQQIPGIIRAVHPPGVDPFAHNSGSLPVEILEKAFGIATILLLVVVLARVPVPSILRTVSLVSAFSILTAYYLFYVLYYMGVTDWPILLGMAAFPPLCFLLVALYQGNYPAVMTSVIFGGVHVGLTYANLGPAAGNDSGQATRPS
jgi:hypothetical protein